MVSFRKGGTRVPLAGRMKALFYTAAVVAVLSTLRVITCLNAIHALLYLIVSLISVAVVFLSLGAPFVAALEVIIYAGAIVVLIVFVVMMLNLGEQATEQERRWVQPRMFLVPALLAGVLIAQLAYVLWTGAFPAGPSVIDPKQVGIALFGPYLLGVEMVAMLLLAGLVGAFHLGRRE